jgi:hypothetical protein
LECSYREPAEGVDREVVGDSVFFGKDIVRIIERVLADQLHIHHLVVQFPDAGVYFTEKIGCAVVAEEQAAITVTDEILVITELKVEVFPYVEIDGSPVVEIIIAGFSEHLIVAGAGDGLELNGPLLEIAGASFLIVGKIGRESQFARDHAPERKTLGIEIDAGRVAAFHGLGLLDSGVDRYKKIFVLDLIEISLVHIERIEPWSFAHKAISVAGDPFDIVHQQGGEVGLVYLRKVVDIVIWVEFVERVGQMGDMNGKTAADGFVHREIHIGIRLLKDLYAIEEMVEFGVLGQKGRLGQCPGRQQKGYKEDYYNGFNKLRHKAS